MIYIVPSRSRPEDVRDLIQRWDEVTEDAYLHIALDSDDPQLQYTLELLPAERPFFLTVSITPPRPPLETLNELAVTYAHTHEMVGYMTDRHRPQTIGWDSILGHLLVSAGGGLIWPNSKPDAVLMSSDIVRAIGCMVPPVIERYGANDIWEAWAADLGGFEATGVEVTCTRECRSSKRRFPVIAQKDEEALTEYFLNRFETDMKIIKGVRNAS